MDEHKIVYLDILAYYNTIIENMIAVKVDKAEGKQLSTNDFTDAEKTKLANIAANATRVIVENVLTSDSTTNALSAAQGKELKRLIDELSDSLSDLGYGDMMKSVYDANDDGILTARRTGPSVLREGRRHQHPDRVHAREHPPEHRLRRGAAGYPRQDKQVLHRPQGRGLLWQLQRP